jgi:GxxExxY protein
MERTGSYSKLPDNIEAIGRDILDAAIRIHRTLGPGLLESAYEACLAFELQRRGRDAKVQRALPITYEGLQLEAGYRLDILVDDEVIVEVKSIDALASIDEAQLLTYLRLSGRRLGYLINFNTGLLKNGVRRLIL